MRILITGGTGTFGMAMASRLARIGGTSIAILSRDELKQHRMLQTFSSEERERVRMFLGDVRDLERLRRAFDGVDVVIHAAALKRIEVGHYNPTEMVKTNVMGAMNVIEAAQDCGVRKVVALSTDKAFQPASPYGCSKAMMESLMLAANNTRGRHGPIYAVTRYGNVAGSNGSVIPLWREKIARGEPIQVTDPDATRFWMTKDEAVSLVWDTIQTMRGGELVIPDCLPAYRVGDLAEAVVSMGPARMREEFGSLAKIEITALPGYEKKHESMDHGYSSDTARRLTILQLQELLEITE